ncbi:MAG: hypothetical protein ACRDKE_02765, partial [Solirubrobacterales bacterium]
YEWISAVDTCGVSRTTSIFLVVVSATLVLVVAVTAFAEHDSCPKDAWCDDGEVMLSPSAIPDWLMNASKNASTQHRLLFYKDPEVSPQSLSDLDEQLISGLRGAAPAGVKVRTITRRKRDAVATMLTYKDSHFIVATWAETGYTRTPETHTTCNGSLYCATGAAGEPAPKSDRIQWFMNGRWVTTLPGGLGGFAKSLARDPSY